LADKKNKIQYLQSASGTLYKPNAYTNKQWRRHNAQEDQKRNFETTAKEEDEMPGLITSFEEREQELLVGNQTDRVTNTDFPIEKIDVHQGRKTIRLRWNIVATPMERNSHINIHELVAALLFWIQKGDSTTKLLSKTDKSTAKSSYHKDIANKQKK
jgi:hypothetical protein